jgi:hypothetical protein
MLNHLKPAGITLVFLLLCVSIGNESCGTKLPSATESAINSLSGTIPAWMRKATGVLTPELSKQADSILAAISTAAQLSKGGSTNNISVLLTSLGATKVKPFLDLWKNKGKLDQTTITNAIKGVNSTIVAIKKAAKR